MDPWEYLIKQNTLITNEKFKKFEIGTNLVSDLALSVFGKVRTESLRARNTQYSTSKIKVQIDLTPSLYRSTISPIITDGLATTITTVIHPPAFIHQQISIDAIIDTR